MTSVTSSRPTRSASRRRVRIAAAALGLAGALALTACSDGGDGNDSADDSPSGSGASASETAGSGGGSGGTTSASDGLQGSWLTTKDGHAVALVISGKQAALFATGGSMCSGTAGDEAGMQMLHLKCTDGNKDRATGMVDSVNKASLKITWEGGAGAETYTRSEGGKLPTGLPTASLGS
ncbi:hypothetical protein [Streptomyces griseus]|uniref:hypothetical protein n=1 Tax=Streptomyces griseus TaxID=1911 RepID=UPI00055A0728|nr:hypothetical protein [Streptomyces griseus]